MAYQLNAAVQWHLTTEGKSHGVLDCLETMPTLGHPAQKKTSIVTGGCLRLRGAVTGRLPSASFGNAPRRAPNAPGALQCSRTELCWTGGRQFVNFFRSARTDACGTRCVFLVTTKLFVFVRLEPMHVGHDVFFFVSLFFCLVGTDACETRCVFFETKNNFSKKKKQETVEWAKSKRTTHKTLACRISKHVHDQLKPKRRSKRRTKDM